MLVVCSYCRAVQGRKGGASDEPTHTVGECCAEFAFAEAGLDFWAIQAKAEGPP